MVGGNVVEGGIGGNVEFEWFLLEPPKPQPDSDRMPVTASAPAITPRLELTFTAPSLSLHPERAA